MLKVSKLIKLITVSQLALNVMHKMPAPFFHPPFFFFLRAENKDPKQKVQAMKKLIVQLPKPNQDTMVVLFSHLQK